MIMKIIIQLNGVIGLNVFVINLNGVKPLVAAMSINLHGIPGIGRQGKEAISEVYKHYQ